jgi:hypothetical protein
VVDVARSLNYVHFDRAIPHGNLKATNILLDGLDRVADYCLHRMMTQASVVEQILDLGLLGYGAPELAAYKKPSKSDVYRVRLRRRVAAAPDRLVRWGRRVSSGSHLSTCH